MNKGRKILRDQRLLLCIVIVVLVVVVGIVNPRFVRLNNIVAILQQISVLGVLTSLAAPGFDGAIDGRIATTGVPSTDRLASQAGTRLRIQPHSHQHRAMLATDKKVSISR